jgi:hypothetical protein
MNRFQDSVVIENLSDAVYFGFGAYQLNSTARLDTDNPQNGGFTSAYVGQTVTAAPSGASGVITAVVTELGFSFIEVETAPGAPIAFLDNDVLSAIDPATGVNLPRADQLGAAGVLTPAIKADSFGPRILCYNGNPNGVLSSITGSLALDAATGGAIYRCTGGSTWVAV